MGEYRPIASNIKYSIFVVAASVDAPDANG
jgi:hypothetical protein